MIGSFIGALLDVFGGERPTASADLLRRSSVLRRELRAFEGARDLAPPAAPQIPSFLTPPQSKEAS